MIKFIIKKLFKLIITLFIVSFFTFILMSITPGDSAETILRNTFVKMEEHATRSDIEFVREKYRLGRPLYKQYFDWLFNFIKGDMGYSAIHGAKVSDLVVKRIPYTLSLGFIAMIISVVIAIPVGMISAVKRNGWFDQIARIISMVMYCIPGFFLAVVLIVVFSIKLDLLPVSGTHGIGSYILPAITLSFPTTAYLIRMMRQSALDVLGEDYINIAKAKGLKTNEIVKKHVFRNAITPIVTVLGIEIGHIIAGSVIAETIFRWPGIGSLLMDSIRTKDFAVVQTSIILIAFGYCISNLLVDIVYTYIDPRINYQEQK